MPELTQLTVIAIEFLAVT